MKNVLIVLLILVGVIAGDAFACQCGYRPDVRTAAEEWSDAVITGKVVEVEPMTIRVRFGGRWTSLGVSRVTIQVDRIWKGSTNGYLVLTQGITNCDYPDFQAGRHYLVFASATKLGDDADAEMGWTANRCLPVAETTAALKDLKQLGDGVPVNPPHRRQWKSESWFQRICRVFGVGVGR